MGRVFLLGRLAVKDLRHRPGQAAALLLAMVTAATTLTLGMALHGATDNPYAQTRAATNGPDAVALESADPPDAPGHADLADLTPLEHAAGVVAHGGPFPVTWAFLTRPGLTAAAEIQGRGAGTSSVDQPMLTQGGWVRPGGVVVEGGFAQALGLRVGSQLSLGGTSFRVVGIAVTAALPSYPMLCYLGCDLPAKLGSDNPGLVWLTTADAEHVAAVSGSPLAYLLDLKLSDPAQAVAFASARDVSSAATAPFLLGWQSIRDQDARTISTEQLVLLTGSWLLGLLAVASVTVLVGGRMAEQTRRLGLLKAVGGTPGFVAAVLLSEHVLLALCAAGAGLLAGWLAAPLLTGPGAGLLGAPGGPAVTESTVGLVLAMTVSVAILATVVPAVRGARTSTVRALRDTVRPPRRRSAITALSAHLPATLLLGVRLAVRRPRRLVLNAVSIAVTVSGIVAVLIVHATVNAQDGFFAPDNPQSLRLDQVTSVISVMLVVLATVNAIFIAWAITLDARHPAALARALGATPRQVSGGLAVAQMFPALAGALLGIPGGIGLYDAASNGGGSTLPPAPWLVAVVLAAVAAVAVLTVIPARIGARRPVAEILQAETA
jgi:ABC-type antimicrobial peptide transport system permease subunit